MSRLKSLKPEFVEFIPGEPKPGVLYISEKYKTATHLCCCGCGSKVVTPLKTAGWRLTTERRGVTLYPSIGNWSFPCQSHYWIRGSKVEWAERMTREEINVVRERDRRDREAYFDAPRKTSWWRKLLDRFWN